MPIQKVSFEWLALLGIGVGFLVGWFLGRYLAKPRKAQERVAWLAEKGFVVSLKSFVSERQASKVILFNFGWGVEYWAASKSSGLHDDLPIISNAKLIHPTPTRQDIEMVVGLSGLEEITEARTVASKK